MQRPENENSNLRKFLMNSPIVQKVMERENFEVRASVDVYHARNLDTAINYIYSHTMRGKARKKVIEHEKHYLYEFEDETDAVYFKLRFA